MPMSLRNNHVEPDDDDELTVSQIAADWGVSRRTIQRYISRGHLPALRLPSGHHRIRRGDADAVLRAKREERTRQVRGLRSAS